MRGVVTSSHCRNLLFRGTETCDWNLMIGRQFIVFICYREKSLVVFVHSLRDEGWLVGERWYSGCGNIKQLRVGNDPEDAQGFSFKLVSGLSFPSVFAQWERGIWQWNFFQISSSWEPQSSPISFWGQEQFPRGGTSAVPVTLPAD